MFCFDINSGGNVLVSVREPQRPRPSPAVMAGSVLAADVAYLHVSTMLNIVSKRRLQ